MSFFIMDHTLERSILMHRFKSKHLKKRDFCFYHSILQLICRRKTKPVILNVKMLKKIFGEFISLTE